MLRPDSFYYTPGTPTPAIPLGTLTVQETKAPNGDNLDGAYLTAKGSTEKIEDLYVSQIKMDGDNAANLIGGNEYSMSDRVIRGDFELTKADEENQERMANIPFKLTSNTTGESHQFVTDENGYYNSSSECWLSVLPVTWIHILDFSLCSSLQPPTFSVNKKNRSCHKCRFLNIKN